MSDIDNEIEFGLDRIAEQRTVEMPIRDALYVYKTLGEFVRFFHQPANWSTIEEVQEFMGDTSRGGLHALFESYYTRLYDVWPPDIRQAFDDGLLERGATGESPG